MQSNNAKQQTPAPLDWSDSLDEETTSYAQHSPTYSPNSPTYAPQSPTFELPPVPTTPPAERRPMAGNDTAGDVPITWAPKKNQSNHFVMPHPSNFPQPDLSAIPPPPPPPKFRSTTNPVPAGAELSIVIPWANRNTKEWFVGRTLSDLEWGYIQGINMIYRDRGCTEHWKIFIHFSGLTEDGKKVKDHLMKEQNKEIAIQHKYGTWKIRASNWNFDQNFRKSQNKPRVEFL